MGYEDTPDRIATWLSGDPQVWLSMLSRPELFKRRVAAEQLALLVGAPIAFTAIAFAIGLLIIPFAVETRGEILPD